MNQVLPETPFLAVDLDLLDRNIARMAQTIVREGGKAWRPHVKAIKTPAIAHKLLTAGAIGVTCAKLSEAEVMVSAGIRDVLVANQIVGARKLRRLASLNRHAQVMAAVDARENVDDAERVGAEEGSVIPLLIEVDIGMRRSGVEPGSAVVELAQHVAARQHVRLAGLMAWEGHTVKIADAAQKKAAIRDSVAKLVESAAACERAGCHIGIVSCGGTGTYAVTAQIAGVTELQAGGGVFGDVRYRDEYRVDHDCALTVWTTVVSRPKPDRIVCDAGWKAMAAYPVLPQPIGLDGVAALRISAEHATLDLARAAPTPRVGDTIQFIVGYSDSTVFLHDELVAMRNGAVELIWPLLARGKLR